MPTTDRWKAVVPCSRTAAGVSGDIPAARSPWQISGRAVRPMRNTRVPPVSARARKGSSRGTPWRLCPVMMCTEEQ